MVTLEGLGGESIVQTSELTAEHKFEVDAFVAELERAKAAAG